MYAAIHIYTHHAVDRCMRTQIYIEGEEKESAVIRALRLRLTWPCFPGRRHNHAALLYMLGNIDCIMLCYAFVCLYLLNIRSLRGERLSTLNSCSNLAAAPMHWTNVRYIERER